MKNYYSVPLALLAASFLMTGCSDDSSDSRMSLGGAWSSFESGNYDVAADEFMAALDQDQEHAEAWCGLGWTRAMMEPASGLSYHEAVYDAFHRADALSPDYSDAWAGLALFHSAEADTVLAIEWSIDLLDLEGDTWQFSHRADVNSRAMHKVAAWNLFKLKRYTEALLQVQAVFPDFQPDTAGDDFLELLFARIGEL
jgi:tetratricopeptide (TPR) repeat protein